MNKQPPNYPVSNALEQLLVCPYCRIELSSDGGSYECSGCRKRFPTLLGIPDFRIPQEAWIDYDEDMELARYLAKDFSSLNFRSLLEKMLETRGTISDEMIKKRIKQIHAMDSKYAFELSEEGWIGTSDLSDKDCIELGCGTGGFLISGEQQFKNIIGIDICMAWLVVAKKRIEEMKVSSPLLCACVEALPFKDDCFDYVAAFDVIEHVSDRGLMIDELKRLTRSGGQMFLTTPNRFSLSAEPHVDVWGVGFLPRRWMARYVNLRTGQTYSYTYLMSIFELRRLFKKSGDLHVHFHIPQIWEGELANFNKLKKIFGICYNFIAKYLIIRPIFFFITPFFQIIATYNKATAAGKNSSETF